MDESKKEDNFTETARAWGAFMGYLATRMEEFDKAFTDAFNEEIRRKSEEEKAKRKSWWKRRKDGRSNFRR